MSITEEVRVLVSRSNENTCWLVEATIDPHDYTCEFRRTLSILVCGHHGRHYFQGLIDKADYGIVLVEGNM